MVSAELATGRGRAGPVGRQRVYDDVVAVVVLALHVVVVVDVVEGRRDGRGAARGRHVHHGAPACIWDPEKWHDSEVLNLAWVAKLSQVGAHVKI